MKISTVLSKAILCSSFLLFSLSANAVLELSPIDSDGISDGSGNGETVVQSAFDLISEPMLYYKKNVDGGGEEGSFSGSYETIFTTTFKIDGETDEESGATITYAGNEADAISCPSCYLAVKDGIDPVWYLFDISLWDGMETITLSGFWADGVNDGYDTTTDNGKGAISNISIWGGDSFGPGPDTPVPEPGTLALLGLGLAGLSLARRKTKVSQA